MKSEEYVKLLQAHLEKIVIANWATLTPDHFAALIADAAIEFLLRYSLNPTLRIEPVTPEERAKGKFPKIFIDFS